MQITITATLTPEQLEILAKAKGYSEGSMEEFVKNVYTSMVSDDATRVFLEYSRSQKAEEIRAEEELIRSSVSQSITSSIG